jgi:hypothetical protein
MQMSVHYANGFDNVGSVDLFYRNPVFRKLTITNRK